MWKGGTQEVTLLGDRSVKGSDDGKTFWTQLGVVLGIWEIMISTDDHLLFCFLFCRRKIKTVSMHNLDKLAPVEPTTQIANLGVQALWVTGLFPSQPLPKVPTTLPHTLLLETSPMEDLPFSFTGNIISFWEIHSETGTVYSFSAWGYKSCKVHEEV